MNLHFFTIDVKQLDLRAQTLALRLAATLRVDHHQRRKTRHVVNLLGNRNALFNVLEADGTGILANDRTCVRVPGSQLGASLDLLTIIDRQGRAIRHFVTLALTAVVVSDQHFARTCDDDLLVLGIGYIPHGRGKPDHTGTLGFDLRSHGSTGGRSTDVEGTHGQLGTRLADGLGSDNADRLTNVNRRAATEVAAITLATQAVASIASQRSADSYFINA